MSLWLKTAVRKQRGIALVWVSLMMVAFFMIAALAFDIGVAYTARTSAQHAADAAALAGAYTFATQPLLTGGERTQAAFVDGAAVAGTYKVLDSPVSITEVATASEACDASQQNLICVDEGKRRVSAVVASQVPTFFGKILSDFLRVRVIAHAEAAENAAGDRCIKPIYISNDAISDIPLGGGTKPSAEDYMAKCNASYNADPPRTIFDASGHLTDYAQQFMANQKSFTSNINDPSTCTGQNGCPLPILTKANTPNPSQVGIIDFNAGEGNGAVDEALVKCAMERCLQECASTKPLYTCGDAVVGLKTGATWGQLEPLNDFIGGGTSKYLDSGSYDNGGTVSSTSPSIVTVLVWDCRQPIQNGTQSMVVLPDTPTIKGIAQLFINKVDQKTTNAFLVGAGPCDESGGAAGTGALPVRLVNR